MRERSFQRLRIWEHIKNETRQRKRPAKTGEYGNKQSGDEINLM